MINKKNLWFLTLFSLVLVLSVYYITMPNELLLTNSGENQTKLNNKEDDPDVVLTESDLITALRVEADNQTLEEMASLKQVLTDLNVSIEDKNAAFEELKALNQNKTKEENLENLIKKTYNVSSFIKIDNDQIRVVVDSKESSASLANNIMRTIQKEFENKMYISVKFQAKK